MAGPTTWAGKLNYSLLLLNARTYAGKFAKSSPAVIQKIHKCLYAALVMSLGLPWTSAHGVTAPIGATAGAFAVSPSGAATYSIPIVVPPGTNGMQPKLSLEYNSQVGNGLVGVGWSIGGLSVIHRCGATIAIDGFKGGLTYDTNDRFCLDGERLISLGNGEYRTQHESWQKVIAYGGTSSDPSYFTVTGKDGTVSYYGYTSDSRIEAQGKTVARLWALNKIQDRNGNYLTITYTEENSNADYRPSRIDYTANAGVAAYNSVQFLSVPRTDVVFSSQGNGVSKITQRLTNIQTFAGTTLVRDYRLNYDYNGDAAQSRLISVTECGSDGVCLPSTAFGWQNLLIGIQNWTYNGGQGTGDGGWQMADIFGDGRQVYVSHNSVNGQFYITRLNSDNTLQNLTYTYGQGTGDRGFQYADIFGDGRQVYVSHQSTGQFYVTRLNPDNTLQNWTYNGGQGVGDGGWQMADIFGDGRQVYVSHQSTGQFYVTRLKPDGMLQNWTYNGGQGTGDGGWQMVDIFGDGRQVYVSHNSVNGQFYVTRLNPDNTLQNWTYTYGQGNGDLGFQYADIFGDGRKVYVAHQSNGQFYVTRLNPDGTLQNWTFNGGQGSGNGGWQMADIFGDGRQVFVAQNSGQFYVTRLNPDGTLQNWTFNGGQGMGNGGWQMADIFGDGRQFYVSHQSTGPFYVTRLSSIKPDLLSSITNGLGAQTSTTYKPLTDNSVYTKDTTPNNCSTPYACYDVQDATYVVSQTIQNNGVSGANTTSYFYDGLKKHHKADASLGFRWIKVTDPAGLVTWTTYNQSIYSGDFSLDGTEGTVASSATTYGSLTLKSITSTWTPNISPSCTTCTVAFLASTQEQTWGLDGTAFPSTTTTYSNPDIYWNPQTIAVSTSDGYTKTTNNIYSNDTVNWYLGRLTQSQVTAHAAGQTDITRTSSFTYDSLNRLATETIEPNQSAYTLTTSYGYDTFGNRTSKTVTGTGIATRTESQPYDARGQFPASKTNALNQTEIYNSYDTRTGALTSMTGPNSLTTTWTYDGFGRKTQENRADGTWTIYSYQLCGSGFYCPLLAVTAVGTQSSGASIVWTYQDLLGRPVRTAHVGFGNAWVFQDTAYDVLGRVVKVSEPSFTDPPTIFTTSIPDALGRPTSVTAPGNRTTTTTYSGLTTSVTNPLNQTRTVVKNSQGQVMQATDAGGTTYYQYDGFGNQVQVTDVANNVTSMTYDIRGRKIAMHDPDMGNWSYTYDVLNELLSQKDALNQTISMVYDKLGRMTSRTTPEGTSTWTYDTVAYGIGKLASVSNSNANESYTYDSLGRPSTVTTSIGGSTYTVTTSYDSVSRVNTVTYPNTGFALQYYYDPNQYGFLTEIKNASTGASYWKINANGVDAYTRITNENFGNGLTTVHDYDPNTGFLLDIRTGVGSASGVQNLAYVFDGLGNLKSRTDNNQGGLNEQFGYDTLNRLTTVSGPAPKTYQYAANGNLNYKSDVGTYTYPTNGTRPHAVSSIAGTLNTSFTYDANGNQLMGNGKTITYTSFNKANTITANGQTDTLTYDASFNRLIKSNASGTTIYIGKLYERITSGTSVTQKHYLYAGNIIVGVYTLNANGTSTTRYFHTDHLGSVDTVTDESGNVVQHLSYDAHGKRRNPNWTDATTITSPTTRGFTRHEMDDEVGLINMNAREYDPVMGRFITPDTIIQTPYSSQGLNRYSYANNNPLSYWDPTGHGWFKKLRHAVQNIVHAQTQLIFHPSVRNVFNLIQTQPGMHYVDRTLVRDQWARELAIAASAFCGPWAPACAAGEASYMTMLMGGSANDAFRAGAIAGASSYAFKDVDSWKTMSLANAGEKILASGVIGGVTSKLQGGSFNEGFESSAISTTARIAWSTIVETQAGVPHGCGDNCVEVRPELEPSSGYTNKPLGVALMDPAANNFSFKVLPGNLPTLGSEGGIISVIADHIPGMNAVADMHDALNPSDVITGVSGHVWFVGSMVISAGVSYSALQYGYHFEQHE